MSPSLEKHRENRDQYIRSGVALGKLTESFKVLCKFVKGSINGEEDSILTGFLLEREEGNPVAHPVFYSPKKHSTVCLVGSNLETFEPVYPIVNQGMKVDWGGQIGWRFYDEVKNFGNDLETGFLGIPSDRGENIKERLEHLCEKMQLTERTELFEQIQQGLRNAGFGRRE